MRAAIFAAAIALAEAASSSEAHAFGAVFTKSDERSTVVTGRHLAVAIGTSSTTIWERISLSTSAPSDVAYVIPILPGSRVELASGAWFQALILSTEPAIFGPPEFAPSGCDCDSYSAGPRDGTIPGSAPQALLHAAIVEQRVFTSTAQASLVSWLEGGGFVVSSRATSAIARLAEAGYDFAAVRYTPGCSARALAPIRISVPRVTTSFPIDLMAIGSSGSTDLSFFALGATRYRIENFPEAVVAPEKIIWEDNRFHDPEHSNYDDLIRDAKLAGFVTEFAAPMATVSPEKSKRITPNGTLLETYNATCAGPAAVPPESGACMPFRPGVADASTSNDGSAVDGDSGGDASADASLDAAADAHTDASSDASTDASTGPNADAGTRPNNGYVEDRCGNPDDYEAATSDIDPRAFTVTRLVTTLSLPSGRTSFDLREAQATGPFVTTFQTFDPDEAPNRSSLCASRRSAPSYGTISLVAATLAVLLRKRRRR